MNAPNWKPANAEGKQKYKENQLWKMYPVSLFYNFPTKITFLKHSIS